MSLLKKALFSLVTTALFFALVEGGLWAAGVRNLLSTRDPYQGFSQSVRIFEKDPDGLHYRTAARAVKHSFNLQRFLVRKPANGLRVFVLGGSSAYGFPWGAQAAFAKLLGDGLAASWPDRTVEVVNAAGMSYGFHRLRILTGELLEYEPDVLVFYEGHNEFVERKLMQGVLANTQKMAGTDSLLFRSRLFAVMARASESLRKAPPKAGADPDGKSVGELLGLDVVREDMAQTVDADKQQAAVTLRGHLEAIVAAARARGVKLVFCTPATNLRDWPPHQSIFTPDVTPERRDRVTSLLAQAKKSLDTGAAGDAVRALEEARGLAPGYADVQFQLGRAYEVQGRWDDARAAFTRARDVDAQPVRSISVLIDTIRKVAAEKDVPLVDIDRVFEQKAPHGLVGFNLVEDYVHPNKEGHRVIAQELWARFNTSGLLGATKPADPEVFARAIGGGAAPATVVDHAAPTTAAEGQANTPAELYNLAYVLERQGQVERAVDLYKQCLTLDPRYYAAALNLGMIFNDHNRPDLALLAFRQARASQPKRVEAAIGEGLALANLRKLGEAEGVLRAATALDPSSDKAWDSLGMVLAFAGKAAEAAEALRRAVQLKPDNFVAQANLGSSLLLAGRPADAIPAFRAALAVNHEHPPARDGLADALVATGALAEAETLYRASLAANPNDRRARAGLAALEKRRAGGR